MLIPLFQVTPMNVVTPPSVVTPPAVVTPPPKVITIAESRRSRSPQSIPQAPGDATASDDILPELPGDFDKLPRPFGGEVRCFLQQQFVGRDEPVARRRLDLRIQGWLCFELTLVVTGDKAEDASTRGYSSRNFLPEGSTN